MSNIYGEWLKAQREGAGLTQQELANRAIMTRSHISHIEAGRRIPSREDARRLDRALNTGDVLSTFLPGGDEIAIADYFEPVRQLQQQATMIREFSFSLVPGLLQTERYARAILGSAFPPVSGEERDRRVVARVGRSELLQDPVTPILWVLLDEAALRRPAGGAEVIAEQIEHIATLTEAGRIRTHVMPLGSDVYPLMHSSLTLMSFEDQPPCAYTEGHIFGKLHDSPSVVERLQNAYDLTLGDALPQEDSLALMRAIAKDHETS
ncbi:helix-turn-helix transcriptional regulator [Streptomyces sp. DSM 44915]|uniref:Helix-turn-helix transcriptional regulator n=1 Tax=Streptomyces chisholmiae TaxID=3075540 RepID=A0ABU2JZT0_9ACTN|nr:helix-turn-helix transcriptional regulator [Streptomyces sp. DSM 44915]MDT0270505.1 helix-turn-helix transcriptional regulator [Streptomyces sp. DSM 44915]